MARDELHPLRRSHAEAEQARAATGPQPAAPAPGSPENKVWNELRTIYDPEIPVNIVDLGLIYEVRVEGGRAAIRMTLTAPGCAIGDVLKAEVEKKVRASAGIDSVTVELVFDPPWNASRMSDAAKLALGLL